jgi:hypothetical protein
VSVGGRVSAIHFCFEAGVQGELKTGFFKHSWTSALQFWQTQYIELQFLGLVSEIRAH